MALTILTGSSQAAAINYSYTTSGSADWASVPTASYFYDITDKTVRFKATNSIYSNIATASFALNASYATQAGFSNTSLSSTYATQAGYATSSLYASTTGLANDATNAANVNGYSYATLDQINIGDPSTNTYDYIVRAQELEQSKFTTINIFNFLNF